MSKVSVIVPVYNVEKYIDKCLNSLVNQTLQDIEIIVVNDGSPDNSQKIIDRYVRDYPDKVKSYIKENGGQGSARNFGVGLSSSDFISFVDSDDYIENDMIEKMYNVITRTKCDIVVCGSNVVDDNYNIVSQTFPNNRVFSNKIEKYLFSDVCVWNKMIRKSIVLNSNLEFRNKVWYEDLDYTYKLLNLSDNIEFIDENLYNYLLRDNSTMNNNNINRNLEIFLALDEMISYSKSKNNFNKFYQEIEFLAIDHIFISSVVRVLCTSAKLSTRVKIANKLIKYVKNNFPSYNKNIYKKKLSTSRKIVYYLIKNKLLIFVIVLFKLKRKLKHEGAN